MPLAAITGLTLAVLATWCTTGSRTRRTIGVLLGIAVMLPPWLLPERPYLLRAVWVLAAFATAMRVTDLARITSWPFWRRLLHVLSVIDSRRLVRRAPRFDFRSFAQCVAWLFIFGAAIGIIELVHGDRVLDYVERWSAGIVGVYAVVSALYDFFSFLYAALGFDTPPLHVAPIFACSVQEFWGVRWGKPISLWLGETFFRPFARRRRPELGLFLAFAVSAAFHAYSVWVALGFFRGAAMAAMMFAYFVAQAVVMLLERALSVTRWPSRGYAWAAHVWTVVWMLALAPVFVEPMIRIVTNTSH